MAEEPAEGWCVRGSRNSDGNYHHHMAWSERGGTRGVPGDCSDVHVVQQQQAVGYGSAGSYIGDRFRGDGENAVVRRHVRCADCRCDRAGNVTFGAPILQKRRECVLDVGRVPTGGSLPCRHLLRGRFRPWTVLCPRADACLCTPFCAYPFECQCQVRTLKTSRSVRRSAAGVSVVTGVVGVVQGVGHAQKAGRGGCTRGGEEDGAATVTFVAQRP